MSRGEITKIVLFLILILSIGFLVYALLPRVNHPPDTNGQPLPESNLLENDFREELALYISDTASNMQTVMAVQNGQVVFEYGDTKKLINCHSARKSILSILIGIAQEMKLIDLDETLADIGIDESKTPLTDLEKSATVRDLLMCRSGIYLPAEAEHAWAGDIRPARGEHPPGSFFFYNNFDFNVLGSILEIKTGFTIGYFMQKYLAEPIGMQDFSASNVVYNSPWPVPNKSTSDYPVYWMYLSARDMAKIGVLVLQGGFWNGKQVVPSGWLLESFQPYSSLEVYGDIYAPFTAFGYSWWIDSRSNTVWADGYGGQFLCIDPANNLVVLQRNFTGNSLLSSGLFLMDPNRDNNPKSDLIHVYNKIRSTLN